MSPEQAGAEHDLDGRTDLYALGCVLYEMLAGQPPFTGSTVQAILARHAIDPVPRLRTVRATVPAGVEEAISRVLNKVPADRFASAETFALALNQGLHSANTWRPSRRLLLGAATVVVLGLALLFGVRSWRGDKAGAGDHALTSLAVLPFSNLTGDTAQVYLAEGLTDQLVTSLAQVSALRVISLKGQNQEATDEAMKDNRIDATLAGSVQRAGNAVHITVKLVSASTHQTLWAQGYDGELSNILTLQAEVARSVATQLRASTTTPELAGSRPERRVVDPVAYDAYLRGTYFHNRAVVQKDFRKAINYLQQAIEADPTYAAAYATLAVCYSDMAYLSLSPPEEVSPKARAAAARALELDSLLGEAHLASGYVNVNFNWEFATAEREFRRGIELNSRNARGYLSYMVLLVAQNRTDEAIAVMKLGQELEPLSPIMLAAAARPYYNARRYDEAIAQSEKALEIDPNFGRAHYWRGLSYEHLPRHADAIREFQQLSAQAPMSLHIAALGHAYAVAGQRKSRAGPQRPVRAGGY